MCPRRAELRLPRAMAGIAIARTKLLHAERTLTTRLERILELNSSLLQRVLEGSSMPVITGMLEAIIPDPRQSWSI
jgi:hypothetical protein